MKDDSVIKTKSKAFAIRIVRLFQFLTEKKKEFILKLQIALKECSETAFWLELLHETDYLTPQEFSSIYSECEVILRMLTSSITTLKMTPPSPNP